MSAERLADATERLFLTLRRRGLAVGPAEHVLGPTQRFALGIVVDEGPIRVGRLASRLGVTEATATRTADALAHAGLVERVRDQSDRRAVLVCATGRGEELIVERRRRLVDMLGEALAALPEGDRDRLVELVVELTSVLEEGARGEAAAARAASAAGRVSPE